MPIIIPLSLRTATLFPEAAMRVSLLADPFRFVEKVENVSVCGVVSYSNRYIVPLAV